jgi:hypothetical protein
MCHIWGEENAYGLLVRECERDHWEDLVVDGRRTLNGLNRIRRLALYFCWLKVGTSAGSCAPGCEPSDSIKCREFL